MIPYDIKYNEWNERGQPGAPVQLFNVFKDFISHNALYDTRRQYILKWTTWHIEWACRSYCNSIWVISKKIQDFILFVGDQLCFTFHCGGAESYPQQLSLPSHGSVTVTVQTHWERTGELFCRSELAKDETSKLLHIDTVKEKLFYHYYHNRKPGKNAAQIYKVQIRAHTLHPTFTILQVPHSHLSFMNEKFIWKGGFYSLLLCSPWRGRTTARREASFLRSSIKPGESPGLAIGQEDTGFSCTRGGLGWTSWGKNCSLKGD